MVNHILGTPTELPNYQTDVLLFYTFLLINKTLKLNDILDLIHNTLGFH
jgi:hypothetical protein